MSKEVVYYFKRVSGASSDKGWENELFVIKKFTGPALVPWAGEALEGKFTREEKDKLEELKKDLKLRKDNYLYIVP